MTTTASAPELLHIATLMALPAAAIAALEASSFGPFEWHACESAAQVHALIAEGRCDALIANDASAESQSLLLDIAHDTALLIVSAMADAALHWLRGGAQDVLLPAELDTASLPLRLRAAIERRRIEREARTAYATDLETGLPHQQQFIEHVSHLLALREREPAPMAVLALRIEGLATIEARLGRDAAQALRRKVGVRLRAGVRASDVVASLGDDSFAVLLGSILAPADASRVGAKLLAALAAPFNVAGQAATVAAALGIGQYPQDGAQPEALLRRAIGIAAAEQAQGRAGFSNFGEAGGAGAAANDD